VCSCTTFSSSTMAQGHRITRVKGLVSQWNGQLDSGRRTVCTTTTNASSGVEITSLVHVCSMIIKALGVATDFMSGGHIPWVRMIPTVKTPSRMWTCVLESTQEFVAPAACIVSELVLWKVPLSRAGLHLASVFRVGGPYLSVALIGTYGW